ncbi:hypothetical protein GGE65_007297 [Skermanella aerolata]
MTTSIQSLDMIHPVISGQTDDSRGAGTPEQSEWRAAGSAALRFGLLTRATIASSYLILGFLVYALNL